MKGTTPPGVRTEQEAAAWVRDMFARVARRYDLANHLLSFNLDRRWRANAVRRVSRVLERPGARVLDLCCGTGDLLLALEAWGGRNPARRPAPARTVFGVDFCHPMLVAARRKTAGRRAAVFEADALRLPLRDASLDLITVAFGFRNLANYQAGLEEMRRLLRPGGAVAILEFSKPPNAAFAAVYHLYSRRVLPLIGGALSGARDAYRYLPESVGRFPEAPDLAGAMRLCGFANVSYAYLTGGIVALHVGERPA
ncbi:MAG: ubiquinone/menaquinone biosynthesis methyltransferase [Bryobacteraceae bacterium]|jgi:demethylmenaquinone methyltransferase/2-methoxy-6-polyprenyl-1,4-benzoquinol methylase